MEFCQKGNSCYQEGVICERRKKLRRHDGVETTVHLGERVESVLVKGSTAFYTMVARGSRAPGAMSFEFLGAP